MRSSDTDQNDRMSMSAYINTLICRCRSVQSIGEHMYRKKIQLAFSFTFCFIYGNRLIIWISFFFLESQIGLIKRKNKRKKDLSIAVGGKTH